MLKTILLSVFNYLHVQSSTLLSKGCCCNSHSLAPCGFSFILDLSPYTFFLLFYTSLPLPYIVPSEAKLFLKNALVLLHEGLNAGVMTWIVVLCVPELFQIEKCKQNRHNRAFCMTTRKLSQNLKAVASTHSSKEEVWLSYCSMQNHWIY